MTVPQETDVNIVRLHYGEHWPVGTIAAQLGVHPDVVKRALGFKQTGGDPVRRPSLIQPKTSCGEANAGRALGSSDALSCCVIVRHGVMVDPHLA